MRKTGDERRKAELINQSHFRHNKCQKEKIKRKNAIIAEKRD